MKILRLFWFYPLAYYRMFVLCALLNSLSGKRECECINFCL